MPFAVSLIAAECIRTFRKLLKREFFFLMNGSSDTHSDPSVVDKGLSWENGQLNLAFDSRFGIIHKRK